MINNNPLFQVFNASPTPGLLIEATGQTFAVVEANEAYARLAGVAATELAGKLFFNLPPNALTQLYTPWQNELQQSFKKIVDAGGNDTVLTYVADNKQHSTAQQWSFRNIAIAGDDNKTAFIYHCLLQQPTTTARQYNGTDMRPNNPAEQPTNDLNKILDLSLDVMCTIDGQGVFISVSAAAEKVWGYQPDEVIGKSILELIHPMDYAKTLQFGVDIMSGQGVSRIENRYLHKNGQVVFMLWSVYWDATDKLNYCVAKDITEKNKQDEILKASEKKYRYLFQNNPTPMFIWDPETLQMTDCNDEALLLYEYNREEFLTLSIMDIRRQQDADVIAGRLKNMESGSASFKTTTTHVTKSGNLIYVSISDHIIEYNDRKAILVQVSNITEQQKAEQELQNKDTLYRSLVENSGDGVVILNPFGGPVYITRSVNRILGYSETETLQLNVFDIVHPEDKHIVTDKMMESLQQEGLLIKGPPLRMMHRDGSYRWLDASLLNMINEPVIQGIICNFRDITDRINAAAALKVSEEKYRQMFQYSPLPKWIYDVNTLEILQVNETAIAHYGYSREEFLSMTIKDLRRSEDIPALMVAVQAKRSGSGTMNSGIFTHQKKNGDAIQIEIGGYALRYEERDCIMVVCNDVTERENALQQLKDKEAKLSAAQQIARIGYWQFDPTKKTLFWSDEVFAIWGIENTGPEVAYDFFLETVYPEDRGIFEGAYRKAVEQQTLLDIQYRIVLPDGSIKWIHEIGKKIIGATSNGYMFEGTIQDITESRLAREQLQISEARNRGIFESQTNYVIRTDLQGNYSFCNKKYIEDFGWRYPGNNLLGASAMLSVSEEHQLRVMNTVKKCFADLNKVFQVEIDKTGNHGKIITTLWDFTCITDEFGAPAEIQCVGTDISARKKAEDALRQSNIRYEYVTKATSDAIWDLDLVNDNTYWGEGFQTIFGHDNTNLQKGTLKWQQHLHPEEAEQVIKNLMDALNGTSLKWTNEYRYRKQNGEYAHVVDKGLIIRDENGKAIRMVGAMQDITTKKKEEQRMKLLESVVTHTSDSVIIAQVEAADIPCPSIIYVNDAFTTMTGFAAEEVMGKSPRFLQGSNTSKEDINTIIESFRTGQPCEITTIGYKKNGGEFWVNSVMSKMEEVNGTKTHWIAVQRDITQKKIAALELQKVYDEKNEILESIGDVFFAVDKNSVVTYWNNQAVKMLQIQRPDILNRNIWDAYPHIDTTVFREIFSKAVEEKKVQHFEDYSKRLQRWFEVIVYPSGNGLSVYFKDINDRKNAEQQIKAERNLIRTLIDNLPDAIYFKDNNARKLISNKTDYELLGSTSEEDCIGKTDLEVLPYDEGIVGYSHDMKILKSGESLINFEQYFIPKSGKPIWLLTTKLPLRNEQHEIVGLLGIGRNITQEKLAEQRLLVLNQELNRHVKQLAASNAELEQFAYIASHDLQEPLRMVTSFLHQIELKYNGVLDDTGRKFIHFAVDGAARMRQIILDLLQFSRIGREEDKSEAISLNTLAEDVLVLCRKQIEEAAAIITIDPLPVLVIPRTPVRQVLQNLISNSLKYWDRLKNEPLKIHISAKEHTRYWEFSIADNGIGIDPMFFDKIFVIFQRLHNQKEYSGTGIGLAITKKIVENLGGKIRVESAEGKGSTFYFTLLK